jgi:LmbE family N-acetylglucosaminyl deacetylase
VAGSEIAAPVKNWCFLSPHLDDVALSCGGLISALTGSSTVSVYTCFCHAPWFGRHSALAKWLHEISGGFSATKLASIRREEDRVACRRLGASHRHMQWHDAVYRKSLHGGFLYDHCIQQKWEEEDGLLISALSVEIRRMCVDGCVLAVPLGVGGHVDHLVARAAAERSGCHSLLYYPEIPYVCMNPADLADRTNDLHPVEYRVPKELTEVWMSSVEAYRSQHPMLESAAGCLRELITNYGSQPLMLYTVDPVLARRIESSIRDAVACRLDALRRGI